MAEAVIQMMHQTLVHKLQLLHQDKSLPVFPSGFGDVSQAADVSEQPYKCLHSSSLEQEAIEVGPRRERAGPMLLLLRGITASLEEVTAWFSTSPVRRYAGQLLWLGEQRPGCATEVGKLNMLHAPFAGSIADKQSLHATMPMTANQLLPAVQEELLAELMASQPPAGPVRLQCQPRALEHKIAVRGCMMLWSTGRQQLVTAQPRAVNVL